jgi:hypothetical protein
MVPRLATVAGIVGLLAACSGGGGAALSTPTTGTAPPSSVPPSTTGATSSSDTSSSATTGRTSTANGGAVVTVDPGQALGTISPLIRGVSGDVDVAYLRDAGITVNSWGGNPSSRFNYLSGHFWNAGLDWEYRNTNYGASGDAVAGFIGESQQGGAAVRLAVPTLGWIAKNDDNDTCSFPTTGGGCGDDGRANCEKPGDRADPNRANIPSTPEMVQAWVQRLVGQGLGPQFIAMDNEPDLWGSTHYDVHPDCPTYEEILDKYIDYSTAMRAAAPDAKLLGPVMCCWYTYWNTAPGPNDGGDKDFLAWFLAHVRDHDQQAGGRSLDAVDLHYYPQSDVFNDRVDPETSARRLRSTRSLWDPTYTDESWINTEINFIPRMKDTIAKSYPDTPLGITEWNFGADGTMNGALAIADVLGIYGREGVYMANYWRSPKAQSPGYFAFKMFGNYDDAGSSFTGTAVATTTPFEDIGSYASLDPATGHLKVMLINKDPAKTADLHVDLGSFSASSASLYRYSTADATAIGHETVTPAGHGVDVSLPAYSISLLDLVP